MKKTVIIALVFLGLSIVGCNSPNVSNQNSSKRCQKSGKSHKQWEVERKIAYLNAHNGDESFKDIVVDKYGNSYIVRGKKLTQYNCYQKRYGRLIYGVRAIALIQR